MKYWYEPMNTACSTSSFYIDNTHSLRTLLLKYVHEALSFYSPLIHILQTTSTNWWSKYSAQHTLSMIHDTYNLLTSSLFSDPSLKATNFIFIRHWWHRLLECGRCCLSNHEENTNVHASTLCLFIPLLFFSPWQKDASTDDLSCPYPYSWCLL